MELIKSNTQHSKKGLWRSFFHHDRVPIGARILMYHRVVDNNMPENLRNLLSGAVTCSAFANQLDFIQKTYTLVSLDTLISQPNSLDNMAAITFDDGYADNYVNALPILKAKGIPATLFMVAGFIESGKQAWRDRLARKIVSNGSNPIRLDTGSSAQQFPFEGNYKAQMKLADTWLRNQCVPLRESALADQPDQQEDRFLDVHELLQLEQSGIKIQSHTLTHPHLTDLNENQLDLELRRSKEILEQTLDSPVNQLAYPYGDFNSRVQNLAKKLGYQTAFSANRGVYTQQSDVYAIPRIGARESLKRFKSRLGKNYSL